MSTESARSQTEPRQDDAQALSQPTLRRHNLSLVLRQLRDHGPASRAQLAAATGMTRTGISKIVEDLLARNLVVEQGTSGKRMRGRPGTMVAVNAVAQAAVGLELNAFHCETVTTDLVGNVVYRERRPAGAHGDPAATAASVEGMVTRAIEAGHQVCDTVAGLVIALPGFIDPHRGVVVYSQALGWRDVDLRALFGELAETKSLWLGFDSVSNLASLAESRRLVASSTPHSLLHIEFGVGIGSGMVQGGRGERGASGALGALGHIRVDPQGRACHCGRRGCLETVAGLQALVERSAPDLMTSWGQDPATLVDIMARRAESGDPAVLAGLRDTADAVGQTVSMAVSMFDPEVVMLGGYVKPLAPWLMPRVREYVLRDVMGADALRFRIDVSPLGSEAALVGAAQVITDRVFDAPSDTPETDLELVRAADG